MEFDVNHGFHDIIFFTNEDDELITVKVQYDWKPHICSKCHQIGHLIESCRVGTTQKWVPKPAPAANTSKPNVDEEGFQMVTTCRAPLVSEPVPFAALLSTSNGFEILVDQTPETKCDTQMTALGAISHPPNA